MYKKILLLLPILYLSGCTVSKPVILNASYKQLNQVKKAYNTTNTRNGSTNIQLIDYYSTFFTSSDTTRYAISFETYATPLTNPLNFTLNQIRSAGTYKAFECSLPFNIKTALNIRREINGGRQDFYSYAKPMQLNANVKNYVVFNGYHLPYDAYTWENVPDSSYIRSYTIDTNLKLYLSGSGDLNIQPTSLYSHQRVNHLVNGEIYFWSYSNTLLNDAPQNCWQEPYLFFDWTSNFDMSNTELFRGVIEAFKTHYDIQTSYQEKTLFFAYNNAINEELTAYEDGYNDGIDEGSEGVGTPRIRQVFRAIQSFLNIDFGFFKLGHVLGGMLVIAIVIFIVRRFR